MKNFVRVVDSVVVETLGITEGGIAINEKFHPDFVKTLVECRDTVETGWIYNTTTGEFSPPPVLVPTSTKLLAYAAEKRWQVETGGIIINGITVATDDRSKMMVLGTRVKAMFSPDYKESWKTADGNFIELPAASLIAISDAVQEHVSASFAVEAIVSAKINMGEITTFEEIDNADWPKNGLDANILCLPQLEEDR